MTASLPMYQFHGTAKANDAWWAGVRQELVARGMENPPQDLLKVDDRVVHWSDPDLVLSQTCGYPLLYALGAKVHLVATPCYDAPGCDGHNYSSVLLVRNDDTREDLESWLNRLVPELDEIYTHRAEGPDDMPAHIKSALTATSLSIPVLDSAMVLGFWQGIFVWEHRHHHAQREIIVNVLNDS